MSNMILLYERGQSMWLDYLDREMMESGGLRQLVGTGLRGVTTNPTIFQQAITRTPAYDDMIKDLLQADHEIPPETLYEWIMIDDVRMAAEILRPVYITSEGKDGYVSVEVSPHLAYDTEGTIKAGRHLWKAIDRPNVMVKIPATDESLPAIERLLAEGVNVNVTLLFSVRRYEQVAQAYIHGMSMNEQPDQVASVASFFLSRIDSKVDQALDANGSREAKQLKGQAAIANAKLAYQRYKNAFNVENFERQHKRGVKLQRLLWASTSTKNPAYPPLLYVDNLIGPNTVCTVPRETLDLFQTHGEAKETLEAEVDVAQLTLQSLRDVDIDIEHVCDRLLKEGVQKFTDSHDSLMATLKDKIADVAKDYATH